MHDDSRLVDARVRRLRREHLPAARHTEPVPLEARVWVVPGEPVDLTAARVALADGAFAPIAPGTPWGAPWQRVWFHLAGAVPAGWAELPDHLLPELVVDLGCTDDMPGFQAEGLLYAATGEPLAGIEPRRRALRLAGPRAAATGFAPGRPFEVWLEASAIPILLQNWDFAPTPEGDPATAGTAPRYVWGGARLALLDTLVAGLDDDVACLHDLAGQLPTDRPRRARILAALRNMLAVADPDDLTGTARAARAALAPALAARADTSAHVVHAVGHAHIDSAWLWPLRETRAKVARTFANACDLLDTEPGFVFAASSAQQYAWVEEDHPDLFARVAAHVAAGGFVPVGGMWVESDTTMPGGESLCRQVEEGQRFFAERFGVESEIVWLPDCFGYSPALPQIARAAGMTRMLTQKLSWNDTNPMPHHTFWWEGLDGSRLFTHFPPVDTYNAELSAAELAHAERTFADAGDAGRSLVPFGWGDGGGGPTREMLQAARRSVDLEGSPRVVLSTPGAFFDAAQAEYPNAPTWFGELYLELHRGTFTSQAATKRGNRRCEHLLREAHVWATLDAVRTGARYPHEELRAWWRRVLLLQFHDILPGSSIAWVHDEAQAEHAGIAAELEARIDSSLRHVLGQGPHDVATNAGPLPCAGVPALAAGPPTSRPRTRVTPTGDGGFTLARPGLEATIDAAGLVASLRGPDGREAIPAGLPAGELRLHRDHPALWDAWDLDALDLRHGASVPVEAVEAVEADEVDGGGGVRVVARAGRSEVTIRYALSEHALDIAVDVDWSERHRLLRLGFCLDVAAHESAAEIQFGHVRRPTHENTSWEAARFETVAHRWVHVGEPGYGVAIANDATYGHGVRRVRHADRSATRVELSLLRSSTFPDPAADVGRHVFAFAVRPGAGIGEAIAEGYRLNCPPRHVRDVGAKEVPPLLSVDAPGVIVESVGMTRDGADVLVRLYEGWGGRATGHLVPGFDVAAAVPVDLLHRPVGDPIDLVEGRIPLLVRPFEMVTLRLVRP